MRVTVTDGNSHFINMEVDGDQQIQDVKALLEAETGIPIGQLAIYFEGAPLNDTDTLSKRGIYEGALIYFAVVQAQPKPKPKPKLGSIAEMVKNFDKQIKSVRDEGYEFHHRRPEEFEGEAKRLVEELQNDPYRLAQISASHPDIGAAIGRGDVAGVAAIMHRRNEERIRELKEKERRFVQLSKDPMNPEYQRMLEERIQQENIDKNLQFANEYLPESFGHITMLYIKASINRIPINAFVDSGAQSTIMSQALAERCGLMRLVDKRQAGKAVGVGSCKILGKVHAAEIEIEGKHLTCSFTVIENNSVEFLLGLDMLRRFNCTIDLGKNVLIFQGGLITTHFLSDGEVEKAKNPKLSKEQLEVKVKKIIDMGFSKAEALETLRACGYNEEVAGNMLMQNKFGNNAQKQQGMAGQYKEMNGQALPIIIVSIEIEMISEKERELALRNLEESLPANLPDPPKYLVELAREKKRLQEMEALRQQKDIDKHLAITLEAYKKCLAEVDKLHMKAVIELKSLQAKSDRLNKLAK